uniref:Uncharacterized protein n=1 Tax=Brassica oleracea var. oleracea TaxID=109376 RepID=A0A0D3AD44_BRAOL
MDPNEERRSMKALKAHFDTLHFVTDSMQGIQERCACGQRLVRERAPAEVFDYLPGKRFFTCKEYKDDGMHYRQPWVCAVEEELGFMKTRLEKCEEYKSLVVKLEVENQELKAEVEKLLARVSQLEYAHKKMASYSPGFVSLLTSQNGEFSTPGFVNLSGSESIDLESPDLPAFSSQSSEASTVKERKKWSPKEDVILISAWLNTSKNPIEYLRRHTPEDLQRLLDIREVRGFPEMIGSIDCMHWEWKNCPHSWKEHQEAARKDVERAFGVLQARFAIVRNPALLWEKEKISNIIRACIILHNMIVEEEQDGYIRYDISEFVEGETSRSSEVDFSFSTNMPSNLGNILAIRSELRDQRKHQRLKTDLIENIFAKFGNQQS